MKYENSHTKIVEKINSDDGLLWLCGNGGSNKRRNVKRFPSNVKENAILSLSPAVNFTFTKNHFGLDIRIFLQLF